MNVILSLATPAIYALLFGTSLGNALRQVSYQGQQIPYALFAVPGFAVLALLTSGMSNSQSVYNERTSGMLMEIMSCPISPNTYLAGKILGTAAVGTCHGMIMLLALTLINGLSWTVPQMLLSVGALALSSFLIVSLYLVICGLVNTLQMFLVAMNLVSMVFMFTSTIFYPAEAIAVPLRWISTINPVTIGCNLMRTILLEPSTGWAGAFAQVSVITAGVVFLAAYTLKRKLTSL